MKNTKFWTQLRDATSKLLAGSIPAKKFQQTYGYLPKCVYGRNKHRS